MRYEREDGCRAWLTYGQLPCDKLAALLGEFGSAEAVYDRMMTDGGAFLRERVGEKASAVLRRCARPEAMHNLMVTMRKWDMGILALTDYGYPDALSNISDPPPLLFYRGNPDCLMGKCVTMVGSRKASPEGMETARKMGQIFSEHGVCVVSGLALGIDGASHEGALTGPTPPAAVLGGGLDVLYPVEHEALRERIVERGGVLLSEYPPGTPAVGWHFPVRNRIMSGLSKAVLFVEGRIRSGSMTTVQHALDQGREVFAYPGNVALDWSEGATQLLREGARYCASAENLLEDLDWLDASGPAQSASDQLPPLPALSPEQREVYARLGRGDASFDQLAADTGLEIPVINGALTMLQIYGLIKPFPGKCYHKI